MTFLFTDIEGSTRQWEESPAMYDRVERHFAVLRAAVDDAGGEVFATMGDGIAAAFTSAEAAVRAAVAAQRQMPAIGLAVRMGIHTGEVERVGDDFRGRPVNRAARIMAVGHGGQILLSDVSAALVRAGPARVELADLGTHRLRDLDRAGAGVAGRPPRPRGSSSRRSAVSTPTPTTCRPSARRWSAATSTSQRVIALIARHRIVTLTGVGGVGKTRLAVHAAADLLSRVRQRVVRRARQRRRPRRRRRHHRRARSARPASPIRWPRPPRCSAGAPTLLVRRQLRARRSTARPPSIDVLTARVPRPVGRRDQPRGARHRRRARGRACGRSTRRRPPSSCSGSGPRPPAPTSRPSIRSSIAELCRRLDGIPLAIELAAARTATLGVAAIVGALDDRLGLLAAAAGAAATTATRTMRATIEWSYRLLDADEQRMFRWLAVFPNGFELDAARHVAALLGIDAAAATEHVASLVHKSMVTPDARATACATGCSRRCGPSPSSGSTSAASGSSALTALAGWVTTITDLPVRRSVQRGRRAQLDPARAGGRQLARGGRRWRRACAPASWPRRCAVRRWRSSSSAATTSPTSCVRCSSSCDDDARQRRAVLTALIVSAVGRDRAGAAAGVGRGGAGDRRRRADRPRRR